MKIQNETLMKSAYDGSRTRIHAEYRKVEDCGLYALCRKIVLRRHFGNDFRFQVYRTPDILFFFFVNVSFYNILAPRLPLYERLPRVFGFAQAFGLQIVSTFPIAPTPKVNVESNSRSSFVYVCVHNVASPSRLGKPKRFYVVEHRVCIDIFGQP